MKVRVFQYLRTRRSRAKRKTMHRLQNRVQNHPVPLFFTSRFMSKWVGKTDSCVECRERNMPTEANDIYYQNSCRMKSLKHL